MANLLLTHSPIALNRSFFTSTSVQPLWLLDIDVFTAFQLSLTLRRAALLEDVPTREERRVAAAAEVSQLLPPMKLGRAPLVAHHWLRDEVLRAVIRVS